MRRDAAASGFRQACALGNRLLRRDDGRIHDSGPNVAIKILSGNIAPGWGRMRVTFNSSNVNILTIRHSFSMFALLTCLRSIGRAVAIAYPPQ
jgi:hypothetical protein